MNEKFTTKPGEILRIITGWILDIQKGYVVVGLANTKILTQPEHMHLNSAKILKQAAAFDGHT